MKIAFFGPKNFIDYYDIGGFQSYIRRIALKLADYGNKVDYIIYDSKEIKEKKIANNLMLKYYRTFRDAINVISLDSYDNIVRIQLPRYDRLKYFFFCEKQSCHNRYHCIYFTIPESLIKYKLMLMEVKIASRYGNIICVSYRQYRILKKDIKNVFLVFPPVSEDYFLIPSEKPNNKKIKITFLGMLHPDKGIKEIITLFKILKNNSKFECSVYGIYNPQNKESFRMHNWLKEQNYFKYIEVDKEKYSPKIEEMVKKVLKKTDIFIQPYIKLENTVDTPLLLLEAMASLCSIITTPLGSILEVYGKSDFIINKEDFISRAVSFLRNLSYKKIKEERQRIFEQNKKIDFIANKVALKFLEALVGEKNESRF